MKTLILVLILMVWPLYKSEEAIPKGIEFKEEYLITLKEVIIKASRYDRIDDLDELDATFRVKVDSFLLDCKAQGIELVVFETWRSYERQDLMKKKGRSKLSGGYSKHQHGKAIDVVPVINGKLTWRNNKLWRKIGKIGKKYNLTWGGLWRFYDPGHLELKE